MTPEAEAPASEPLAPDTGIDTAAPVDTGASSVDTPDQTPTQDQPKTEEPTDLLSVVTAVLDRNKPPAADVPAEGDTSGAQSTTSGLADPATGIAAGQQPSTPAFDANGQQLRELTEADFADVEKPSVKKRIDALLSQRAQARADADNLRGNADLWQRHVDYMQGNAIAPQDAQTLYQVGALLSRGDFKTFVEVVRPYYEAALRATGDILPPDIQQRVDDGQLAEQDASELAQARAAAAAANQQARFANTRVQATHEEQAAARQATHVRSVQQALVEWERGVTTRDPDWNRKKDAVTRYAQAMRSERGLPPDAQTAMQWAEEAYASVNGLISQNRPAVQATRQRPSSVSPATQAFPQPKTMREAIELALRQGTAA
jgi:hypothetical protein